jgi:hypothetical protein
MQETVPSGSQATGNGDVLLEVNNLKMHFPVTSGMLFQRTVAYVRLSTIFRSLLSGERRWAWLERAAVERPPQAAASCSSTSPRKDK